MKKFRAKNVYIRTAIRKPFQTGLLMLLVAAVAFGVVMRVIEYQIAREEVKRIEDFYPAVGHLTFQGELENWDDELRYYILDTIAESQYVKSEDRRRAVTGVMRDIQNANYVGWSQSLYEQKGVYYMDVYMYATVKHINRDSGGVITGIWVEADWIEAGYEENANTEEWMQIMFSPEHLMEIADFEALAENLEVDNRYFIRAVAVTGGWPMYARTLHLRPLMAEEGVLCLPMPPGIFIDINDPQMQALYDEVSIMRDNTQIAVLVGTADMTAIPSFAYVAMGGALGYRLLEGRMLNLTDSEEINPVCVIPLELAITRGLEVGDMIEMDILTSDPLLDPYSGYFNKNDTEYWRNAELEYRNLEIVGIYNYSRDGSQITGSRAIYIPASLLPYAQWPWYPNINNCSFVLHSIRDMAAFTRENGATFAELGYQIAFMQSQAQAIIDAADEWTASASANLLLSCLYIVPAGAVITFLYLLRHRRELAILRAIGSSVKKELRNFIVLFFFMCGISTAIGGILGWMYITEEANRTLVTIDTSVSTQVSELISLRLLPILCIGIISGFVLLSIMFFAFAAGRSTINLLQGAVLHRGKDRHKSLIENRSSNQNARNAARYTSHKKDYIPTKFNEKTSGFNTPAKHSLSCSLKYAFISVNRRGMKFLLTALLALMFLVLMGWMHNNIDLRKTDIDNLYDTFEINAEINIAEASMQIYNRSLIIRPQIIDYMMDSGFIQDAYLEAAPDNQNTVVFAISTSYYNEAVEVSVTGISRGMRYKEAPFGLDTFELRARVFENFDEGYDEGLFNEDWDEPVPLVLPGQLLSYFSVSLGDTVNLYITTDAGIESIKGVVAGTHATQNSNEVVLPLSSFLDMTSFSEVRYVYQLAEFDLISARNKELSDLRVYFSDNIAISANPVPIKLDIFDWELVNTVEALERNVDFLEILYPLMLAVGLVIQGALACIITLQRIREGAVLRVLGNSTARVRAMLCIGQSLPCVLGLLIGLSAAFVFLQSLKSITITQLLLCFGLSLLVTFAGSFISSFIMTRKMPLGLLQEDE